MTVDYNALIEEISQKYNYDDELKVAIRLTLPLMVKSYGEDQIPEICNLFRNTRIFATADMGASNRNKIENIMVGDANEHIVEVESEDPYQTNMDPGSYYSYRPIYDSEMNVIKEERWVVVKDMKDSFNSDDYFNLFGTTINMPYFIHELNHAFAMQNPLYRKDGDTVYSKHGMIEEQFSFTKNGDKIEVKSTNTSNIIIEEAVNEKYTQDMLVDLLQVGEYSEVSNALNNINHVGTSYNPILVSLADKLISMVETDNLLKYRKENDESVLSEFNQKASQSAISSKYCDGMDPYDYFDQKCFGLFLLSCNGYKMPIEEYTKRSKELMVEAFAPLCAYQNIKQGNMSLEKFETIRNSILGITVDEKKEIISDNPKK